MWSRGQLRLWLNQSVLNENVDHELPLIWSFMTQFFIQQKYLFMLVGKGPQRLALILSKEIPPWDILQQSSLARLLVHVLLNHKTPSVSVQQELYASSLEVLTETASLCLMIFLYRCLSSITSWTRQETSDPLSQSTVDQYRQPVIIINTRDSTTSEPESL